MTTIIPASVPPVSCAPAAVSGGGQRVDLDRRAFLRGARPRPGGAAGVALGAAALAGAALWAGARRAGASPADVAGDVDPGSLIHKLVGRLTFGFTQAELTLANSLGYEGYLEYQLDPFGRAENPALTAMLATLPVLGYQPYELYDTNLVANSTTISNQLVDATIFRAWLSNRQLLEKMVEFWGDHFSIDGTQDNERYTKLLDDRALRPIALTSFPAVLNASARSPAMMSYLDNEQSSNNLLNENYARELIELHTVGADFFYAYPDVQTQATIVAVARCLTGWGRYGGSFNDTSPGGTGTSLRGTFFYNSGTVRNAVRINGVNYGGVAAGIHDTGSKALGTLFGAAVIPAGRSGAAGQQDGQDVLNLLCAHPATASYIALKLCRRFLGEGVPQSIVDLVRDAYLTPNPALVDPVTNPQGLGDIKAMIRVMMRPNHLAQAFPRLKRPFHLFVSALRALPATVTTTTTLRQLLQRAGHLCFAWATPDGYPDTTAYWSGLVLPRWSFGASLVTNSAGNPGGINGVVVDDAAFFSGVTTGQQVVDRIDAALFGGAMSAAEKAAILGTLTGSGTASQRRDALGLGVCSPTFQWY